MTDINLNELRVTEVRAQIANSEAEWMLGLHNLRSPLNAAETLALLDRVTELEAQVARVELAIDHDGMVHVADIEDALRGDRDE